MLLAATLLLILCGCGVDPFVFEDGGAPHHQKARP
jgi:hypothetical protein